MYQIKNEIDYKDDLLIERPHRSIIQINAQNRPDLTDETFISNRDKLVRQNRIQNKFNSPDVRIGTQLRPFRTSKPSLMSEQQLEEFNTRPETNKADKRIMSSGFSRSKDSTRVNSKVLKGFGISVRTLYGKNTPLAFSNYNTGANTPANEYTDTAKSWMINNNKNRIREDHEKSRIAKTREIGKIMKKLGKAEQDRNVHTFKNLIKDEKNLHKELIELNKNQREREMLRKRYVVFKDKKRKSIAQQNRDFAVSFSQHKNLIVKHASLGEKKRREWEYREKIKRKKNNSFAHKPKFSTDDSMTSIKSYVRSGRYYSREAIRK